MEDMGRMVGRSSSCQGVAFESCRSNKTRPVMAIVPPAQSDTELNSSIGRWVWVPWNQKISSDVLLPMSHVIERSISRPSSHFCDLDFEDASYKGLAPSLEELEDQCQDLESPKLVHDQINKEAETPKPAPHRESRLSVILLDQGLFTVYKRLFVLSVFLNMIFLMLGATGLWPYAKRKASLFTIGNILALTLCRSEAFLRGVFWLFVKVLGRPCVPLQVKTATTSFLQSLGGIHSGCGVSSIAWLVYALVLSIRDRANTSREIIAVAFTILSLLCLSSLAAFPLIRHLHHNVFERTHRFAGWASLLLLWIFIFLTICNEPTPKSYETSMSRIAKAQEFWFTLAINILIILPWVSVKRVPVKVTSPSNHATIIKFEGGVKAGILGRISPSPLSEWHAFGIISDGKKDHMMLAGAVGDFTKSLVSDPPRNLWVRGLHFAGLPYLVNLYERVVLVATGSGICVFLSFLLQPCSTDVCLVWVAKGVEQNFGKEIKEMVSGFPKEKVIVHDTAISGRPNVAKVSVDAARNWKAQVVIVTSNPQGSRDVVEACKAAGIPAFGPIWDS